MDTSLPGYPLLAASIVFAWINTLTMDQITFVMSLVSGLLASISFVMSIVRQWKQIRNANNDNDEAVVD